VNIVFIRFYEELNDFLPFSKQKVLYSIYLQDNPSIKAVVESEGIPHTEVDLILINGHSVTFQEKVHDNDYISVYPKFESFDISSINVIRLKPLREPKFILDVHLGKLARYMRMLGFDSVYDNSFTDAELIRVSVQENRTLLTRNRKLLMKKEIERGYWIRNEQIFDQVYELFQRFDLKNSIKWFSLCTICNGNLHIVEEELVRKQFPEFKFYQDTSFYQCDQCNHIYWNGSHSARFKNSVIKKILNQPAS
jgi:uncharacterized protein with PIN domain